MHWFKTVFADIVVSLQAIIVPSSDCIRIADAFQNSKVQSLASREDPCLPKMQCERTVDI
jgi:hypothetical protein